MPLANKRPAKRLTGHALRDANLREHSLRRAQTAPPLARLLVTIRAKTLGVTRLEFSRRSAGLALPIVAGVFMLYSFVGPWMPGVLRHKGFNIDRFFTYIYSEYGVFGVTTQVSSSYIILFVCFAAFLKVSRVGDYINDLCNSMFG